MKKRGIFTIFIIQLNWSSSVYFFAVYSDLAVVLSIFGFSFTAFLSISQYVLRHHVFHVRPGAHLRSAQQRFKAVLVGDDKGVASLASGHSLRQLR